ncbi:MAG: hypothetical protein IIW66_05950 [Bacteroidales bacterium]|nr:hypothetical protein [Bacteroidales bacterium]
MFLYCVELFAVFLVVVGADGLLVYPLYLLFPVLCVYVLLGVLFVPFPLTVVPFLLVVLPVTLFAVPEPFLGTFTYVPPLVRLP